LPEPVPSLTAEAASPPDVRKAVYEEPEKPYISINDIPELAPEAVYTLTDDVQPSAAQAETNPETDVRELADTCGYKPYLIKVNRLKNCVTVYTYDEYGGYTVPVRAMVCSCGGEKTPLGSFNLSDKYPWGYLLGGVWGLYCTKIVGGILFHSVPYSESSPDTLMTEEYNKLGTAASHGCVRLTVEDAKWIFENCEAGTEVIIYDDKDPGPLGKPEPITIPLDCGWDPKNPDPNNPWLTGTLKLEADGILRAEEGSRVNFLEGVTATDACGDDILSEVRWKTKADLAQAGSYTVFYFVTDAVGNKAALKRIIRIYEPGTLSLYDRESAEAAINAASEKYHTMGISVAVIENGKIADTIVCGDAVHNAVKMTSETKIRIASISKIGVAFAAARLYDEGLIKPDEDISTYWGTRIRNPNYPDTPITIRDIMCHTSSMTSDDSDYLLSTNDTLVKLLSGDVFVRCKPGASTSFMYNNYAFGVLADTLELACGEVLDDYLKENVFKPLDIEASYSTPTLNKDELAELYDADWNITRSIEHISTRPIRTQLGGYMWYYAGNLTISAPDLAKLAAVLINDGVYDGKRILSPEAVSWLEEPQFSASDEVPMEFIQCLPLRLRQGMYGRKSLYYHTGHAYGVCALLCYDPDSGDGVAVITTGAYTGLDDYGVTDVCSDIAAPILDLLK
jgi:CubicO group peptidase (beta-lactamase class C family)